MGITRESFLLAAATLLAAIPSDWAVAQRDRQINPEPSTPLNTNAGFDDGDDANPHVETDGAGTWVAVWHSDEDLGGNIGSDTDLFYAVSLDNGLTWAPPAVLNGNADSDSGNDELPKLAADGRGNWVAVWWSNENLTGSAGTDKDIFAATSSDNASTWSPPFLLNSNGDSDSGDDAWPQVVSDGAGNWVAVWWSDEDLGGETGKDIDIFVAASADNGRSWTAPSLLNTNDLSNSATNYESEPRVATDSNGNWIVVWRHHDSRGGPFGTDSDISIARSMNNGADWTPPLMLNANARLDSGHDQYPVIATDSAGNWMTVWSSYESLDGKTGNDRDILVATSTDNGATWSPPSLLNTNGVSDSADDLIPQLATDECGNWLAVWWSGENLDGLAGTDTDIFFALSADFGTTWTPPRLLNTYGIADKRGDYVPQVATDGAGNWILVWDSAEQNGDDSVGSDFDIFVSRIVLLGD